MHRPHYCSELFRQFSGSHRIFPIFKQKQLNEDYQRHKKIAVLEVAKFFDIGNNKKVACQLANRPTLRFFYPIDHSSRRQKMPSRKISDVIRNQKVLCAEASMTVREAACQMAHLKVGSMLIVENELLIGIFTERDVLNRVVAARQDPDTTLLATVMTKNPQTVKADRPFSHAMHMMYEGGFRHMPVVEDGKPLGMLSIRDALGPELTEFESELERRDNLTEIMM
jgi:CBS domain-containing protein